MSANPIAIEPLAARLPRLSASEVAWQRVARRAGWSSQGWTPALDNDSAHLLARCGDTTLELRCATSLWPELAAISQLSDATRREAALSLVLDGPLEYLRHWGLALQGLNFAQGDARHHAVGLHIPAWGMALMVDHDSGVLAETVLENLARRSPTQTPASMAHWTLRTTVRVGKKSLPRCRLNSLRPGSGLVGWISSCAKVQISNLEHWLAPARLRWPSAEICIMDQFNDPDIVDDQTERPGGSAEPAQDGQQSPLARVLSELPVEITCALEGPRMTVAQACTLAAGEVLTLPTPLDQAVVTVSCQGRAIARGRLVCVGSSLAVVIEELERRCGHADERE